MIVQGPWAGGGDAGDDGLRQERRATRRTRGLLSGKLVYGSAGFTLDCAIKDLTAGGARIRLIGDQAAPDGVHLIVIKTGIAFGARTVWRRWPEAGLRFLSAVDLNAPPAQAQAMRQLWMQLKPR